MKNKSGAMEIVLLVLLVFLVVTVVLFTFAVNPSYAKANVYDARFVENVYQKQDLAEFYIRQVGEEVLEKTGESDFKENFKMEFERHDFAPLAYPETFPGEMSTEGKDDLKELKKIISEGKFNVFVEEGVLEVVINDWVIKDSLVAPKGVPSMQEDINIDGKIQITYTPKISVKFDLKN